MHSYLCTSSIAVHFHDSVQYQKRSIQEFTWTVPIYADLGYGSSGIEYIIHNHIMQM